MGQVGFAVLLITVAVLTMVSKLKNLTLFDSLFITDFSEIKTHKRLECWFVFNAFVSLVDNC